MVAVSIGIIIHAIGYLIYDFEFSKIVPVNIFMTCGGGMCMITGQSIVLWSRLSLRSRGKNYRWLL